MCCLSSACGSAFAIFYFICLFYLIGSTYEKLVNLLKNPPNNIKINDETIDIIRRICQHSHYMDFACASADNAITVYREKKVLPKTITCKLIESKLELNVKC